MLSLLLFIINSQATHTLQAFILFVSCSQIVVEAL